MLSILIVDDTPEKITAIQELVKNSGISTEPVIVNDLRKAIKEMGEHLYDLVHYCPIKKGNSIFETVEL